MTENRLRLQRARPVVALAAVAFAIGAVVGAHRGESAGMDLARNFVAAWTRGDYAAMYADVDAGTRSGTSPDEFAAAYRRAITTATAFSARISGRAHNEGAGRVGVPVTVQTHLFGQLELTFHLPVSTAGGEGSRVTWSRSLAFPGVEPGETLTRQTTLPRRAPLLARDGSVLASGPAGDAAAASGAESNRESPLGEYGKAVLGTVGSIPASHKAALEAEGVPSDALVGQTGLELALDAQLRGRPGGQLLAGDRVLASASPYPALGVRTSISPAIQRAVVTALGGQLGGIVAMSPNGQILGVAGIGLDGLQPPGSTFKMVTLTGALSAHIANPHTTFPYATYATLDGVKLNNANSEECGGTLEHAFAVSCNSVFTPLGVKLGAERLVTTAEGYGFNQETGIAGAPKSTLPQASQIQGELAIGSTAIGQGQVLATPLQMAVVAATVADGGRRPSPTFLPEAPHFVARASTSAVAHTVRRLMIGVVNDSGATGTAAAIPGVTVAGKTGTAELKTECTQTASSQEQQRTTATGESSTGETQSGCQSTTEASNTDAWFAAFAPALSPRMVVCVMLVKDGAGGTTAAPLARQVLEAGLQAHL